MAEVRKTPEKNIVTSLLSVTTVNTYQMLPSPTQKPSTVKKNWTGLSQVTLASPGSTSMAGWLAVLLNTLTR